MKRLLSTNCFAEVHIVNMIKESKFNRCSSHKLCIMLSYYNFYEKKTWLKSIYFQSCQFQACHANPSTSSASHESNKHGCISFLPWDLKAFQSGGLLSYKRTCKAKPEGENSSFIFTVCVKSAPFYNFKLCYVVLHMAVKEFLETDF